MGIKVINGGIQASNSAGVTIIDGQSDIFKIATSGTMNATAGANNNVTLDVSFPGLGVQSAVPAYLAYVSDASDATTTKALQGTPYAWINAKVFVATTSGGSPTTAVAGFAAMAQSFSQLDGSNFASIRLFIANYGNPSSLQMWNKYYVLQEAAQ